MASKTKYRVKNAVNTVLAVLLLLLVVGGVVFLFRFTNGFQSDFVTFYVVHDGTDYMQSTDGVAFATGEDNRFDVKYTLGILDKTPRGYTVSIAAKNDFDFVVDNDLYSWNAQGDVTRAFDIQLSPEHFTVSVPQYTTVHDLLETLYQKPVETPVDLPQGDLFVLIISSADGKQSIVLGFNIAVAVQSITLDGGYIF